MYASRFYDYHDSDVFSRVHATLRFAFTVRPSTHPTVHHSVDPSIGSAFKLYRFFFKNQMRGKAIKDQGGRENPKAAQHP